jgi:hypothetical protein
VQSIERQAISLAKHRSTRVDVSILALLGDATILDVSRFRVKIQKYDLMYFVMSDFKHKKFINAIKEVCLQEIVPFHS